jgi:hypothetical protein
MPCVILQDLDYQPKLLESQLNWRMNLHASAITVTKSFLTENLHFVQLRVILILIRFFICASIFGVCGARARVWGTLNSKKGKEVEKVFHYFQLLIFVWIQICPVVEDVSRTNASCSSCSSSALSAQVFI